MHAVESNAYTEVETKHSTRHTHIHTMSFCFSSHLEHYNTGNMQTREPKGMMGKRKESVNKRL